MMWVWAGECRGHAWISVRGVHAPLMLLAAPSVQWRRLWHMTDKPTSPAVHLRNCFRSK
jgi:hypothetical protein